MKGICVISSVVGKPLAFEDKTWFKAKGQAPMRDAHVLIEIAAFATGPAVIMVPSLVVCPGL